MVAGGYAVDEWDQYPLLFFGTGVGKLEEVCGGGRQSDVFRRQAFPQEFPKKESSGNLFPLCFRTPFPAEYPFLRESSGGIYYLYYIIYYY